MWRYTLRAAAVCAALGFGGCGESGDAPESARSPGKAPAFSSADLGKTPAAAVQEFLQAVKEGNDAMAAQMLTPVAKKTAEMEMEVAPPGSDTATFEVGEVEMISDDVAHVASTWTDFDGSGAPHSDIIVWMLHKESTGWRIGGMATKVFDDEPPVMLNFENPEEMIRKQQLVEQEIQRRMRAMRQANQPQQSPQTGGQQAPQEPVRR